MQGDYLDKSYIMLKPDGMEKPEIKDYIAKLLDKSKLQTKKKTYIEIDAYKVAKIWPGVLKDPIRFNLQLIYLCQCKLEILSIEGTDAIKKVHEIKKIVRKRYGKNVLINCMHSPMTDEEYLNDIKYIYSPSKRVLGNYIKDFEIRTINGIECIRKEQIEYCSIAIWNILKRIDYEESKRILLDIAIQYDGWCVFLANDNCNSIIYVVSALCKCINSLSFVRAYYIVLGAHQLGDFPILITRDINKCISLSSTLREYNVRFYYKKL